MEFSANATTTTGGMAMKTKVSQRKDASSIVTMVPSVVDAKTLPCGTVVGDLHGGLTFSDAVATVLEDRSVRGWHEVETGGSERWTVIVINR
jgi:hypothetical protein